MLFLRAIALALTIVIALASMLFLLPWLKEGHGIEELPLFASMAGTLGLLSFLWLRATPNRVRTAGLSIVLLPFCAYTYLCLKLIYNVWHGYQLAKQIHIEGFVTEPVNASGFDGPIGLRIRMELVHPAGLEANLFTPKIARTDEEELGPQHYFGLLSNYDRTFLAVPVFSQDGQVSMEDFRNQTRTRLDYLLYSSQVQRMKGVDRICYSKYEAQQRASPDGPHLAACWVLVIRSGAYVNLGPKLNERLRNEPSLAGAKFTEMLSRLERGRLVATGYTECPNPQPTEICYCR